MAELGSTNIHGDLSTTGDHNVGGNSLVYGAQTVQGNQDTKGTLTEKGQRVFSPNNRNISTSVANSSSTIYAATIAVKNAYDKGVQAYNLAAGKLATNGKAYDSTRLGGKFNSAGAGANTIAQRDGSGDLLTRLFRTNYGNETRVTGAMAFRVNTSDNYIRFCSSQAAIRAWLGVYSKAESNSTANTAWTLLRSGSQAGNYISPVSLAGKEVCFVSTDRGGTNEIAVTKVFIPAISGFSNDTNCYIPNGNRTIDYDYYTREIRTYGDLGNRQIWYRTPPANEYPAIGTLRP